MLKEAFRITKTKIIFSALWLIFVIFYLPEYLKQFFIRGIPSYWSNFVLTWTELNWYIFLIASLIIVYLVLVFFYWSLQDKDLLKQAFKPTWLKMIIILTIVLGITFIPSIFSYYLFNYQQYYTSLGDFLLKTYFIESPKYYLSNLISLAIIGYIFLSVISLFWKRSKK